MPRKTKDLQENEKEVKKIVAKKTTTKKETAKKATKKTATTKKPTSKAENKSAAKKSPVKKVATKKSATKKTTEKAVTKKSTTKKTSKKSDIIEYYDLPYRYNQTIVKILAQTPTTLFIYWDISDEDRENYKKQFGDNFFETTKPVLKIFNDTMNYSFEVEINDFANSWYLHINDAKCDYRVELGRRPIFSSADIGGTNYVYISNSNEIEAPNDKILIDKAQQMVYFRNIKTNQVIGKSFANISLLKNMGKIYNIYDLYKELYGEEDLCNPSSRFF